jgi:hypothetical protein
LYGLFVGFGGCFGVGNFFGLTPVTRQVLDVARYTPSGFWGYPVETSGAPTFREHHKQKIVYKNTMQIKGKYVPSKFVLSDFNLVLWWWRNKSMRFPDVTPSKWPTHEGFWWVPLNHSQFAHSYP